MEITATSAELISSENSLKEQLQAAKAEYREVYEQSMELTKQVEEEQLANLDLTRQVSKAQDELKNLDGQL